MIDADDAPYGAGAICERCGHFAGGHSDTGCIGVGEGCKYGCEHRWFLWMGAEWPRPWRPAWQPPGPRGLAA